MLALAPLLSQLTIQTKDLTTERFNIRGNFGWAQREFIGEIERQYNQRKPVRILVLKARQLGISTATEGVLFWWAFLHPGTNGLVIANDTDTSQSIFEKTKLYWEQWPYQSLYRQKYATQKRMVWEPIKSSLRVATARNVAAGRGSTIHGLHASECAFYLEPETLFTGLNQTIPNKHGSIVILESTANGRGNWFHTQWEKSQSGDSDYVGLFFPWYRHYEYRVITTLNTRSELNADERNLLLLMRRDGLSEEDQYQAIAWRRWAIPNLADYDEEYFMQEYPATPREAFISTGTNVFPLKKLEECYAPLNGHRGMLVEDGHGVRWVAEPSGNFYVFKRPTSRHREDLYFVSGDPTQTVTGDPACIQVINRQTMEQVAVWHGHVDPINFAKEMMLIGRWYNNAELCPEVEGGGSATIATILTAGYPNVWMHRWADKAPGKISGTNFGWLTNWSRKNWAIGRVKYLLSENAITIHDKKTYEQMGDYVVLAGGIEMGNANRRGNDDAVMALAIGVVASQTEGPVMAEPKRTNEARVLDMFGGQENAV